MVVTGIVEQKTWEALTSKILFPSRLENKQNFIYLQEGDTGQSVIILQEKLKVLGFFYASITGSFGPETTLSVSHFQSFYNLPITGIMDNQTWKILMNETNELADTMYDTEQEVPSTPFSLSRPTLRFGDVSNAIVVSNHINAGGGEGAEVIYALRNTPDLARDILTEIGNTGQKTRSYYQRSLPSDPTKDYYYIMRDTNNLQTLIVEYAFLDNTNDALRLQKNWDLYAEATVKAIVEYMGLPYYPPNSGKITYIVRSGDTLYSLANMFNTTINDIKQLNNLTNDTLSVGQQLFIPGNGVNPTPPSGNIVYVVKSGDTLFSIANTFNTTINEIKQLNNLTSNLLSIGQQLFIPGTSIDIPETSPTIYTVKQGDTLFSIANVFNSTIDNLKNWNHLTNTTLTVGQRLIVSPGGIPTYRLYTVLAGDTLWSIANRFNTTVDKIKQLNDLTNPTLSIGQQLRIPIV